MPAPIPCPVCATRLPAPVPRCPNCGTIVDDVFAASPPARGRGVPVPLMVGGAVVLAAAGLALTVSRFEFFKKDPVGQLLTPPIPVESSVGVPAEGPAPVAPPEVPE